MAVATSVRIETVASVNLLSIMEQKSGFLTLGHDLPANGLYFAALLPNVLRLLDRLLFQIRTREQTVTYGQRYDRSPLNLTKPEHRPKADILEKAGSVVFLKDMSGPRSQIKQTLSIKSQKYIIVQTLVSCLLKTSTLMPILSSIAWKKKSLITILLFLLPNTFSSARTLKSFPRNVKTTICLTHLRLKNHWDLMNFVMKVDFRWITFQIVFLNSWHLLVFYLIVVRVVFCNSSNNSSPILITCILSILYKNWPTSTKIISKELKWTRV